VVVRTLAVGCILLAIGGTAVAQNTQGTGGQPAASPGRPAPGTRAPAPGQFTQTQPAQQATPQPPVQSPPPQPVRTEILKFDSWTATCHEFAEGARKRACTAQLQIQQSGSNQIVLTWVVLINDNKQLVSVMQTPTGVAIAPGVELKLEKAAPRKVAYESCDNGQCISTQILDNNLMRDLAAAPNVQVTIQAINGQQVNFNFPIKGIDRALTHLRGKI
jgi:invasion protein IalB